MASREYLREFTIVPASREQMLAHARAAFVIWHKGQDFPSFFAGTQREYDEGAWGKDGGLQAWVLVRRDDPSGEIYAGCEAYRRTALIRRKGQDDVSEGYMYAIASVVTPVEHLKKGYATHMLRLLHYVLAEPDHLPPFPVEHWGPAPPALREQIAKQTPGGIGSILWSDVGYKFYEKCTVGLDRPGWKVHKEECSEVIWKILRTEEQADEGAYKWEWICQKDIPALSEEIKAISIDGLKRRTADSTLYAPDPTSPGLLDWIQVRGPWLSHTKPKSPNQPFGLRTKTRDGQDSIVLFSPYGENIGKRLLITLVHDVQPDQLPSLLAKLDAQAHEAGRTEGWVWGLELDSELVKAWQALPGREANPAPRQEIDGHLLGIAWYGAEEDQGEFVERQMWDWC